MTALENKSIVVVGASSGIGRAIARLASEQGATVHLLSRTERKLRQVQETLPGPSEVYPVDMLDEESVNEAFASIGAFDYMTVTAVADEVELMTPIRTMSTETARRGMEKFWGTFNCCRAAANHIRSEGAIVVTSSIGVYRPSKGGASVMNAASAAVTALARALALEIAPTRVNVIAPGVVGTGVWTDEQREDYEDWAAKTLPVGHLGKPEELAQAYLAALTNTYMSGSVITVDGGLEMV